MPPTEKQLLSTRYFPNDTDADIVKKYKRAGCTDKFIADAVGLTLKQTKENYPFEMGMTDVDDLAVVANVAYNMATSGEHPNMTKWWLTVKGGWMYAPAAPQTEPLKIVLDTDVDEDSNDIIEHE